MNAKTKTKPASGKAVNKAETEFAKRLEQACSNHREAPAGYGRLTWLRKRLADKSGVEVTLETVRKWASGEARPRPEKMTELAQALEVDEAWLSLGIAPDLAPRERKARNAMADGAVNVVAGFIQMAGGHPAFPDKPSEEVDLFAIIRGAQYSIRVILAQEVSKGAYKFAVPSAHNGSLVLGVVPTGPMKVEIVELSEDLVHKHGAQRGGFVEVGIMKKEGAYTSGRDAWPIVKNFSERI